MAVLVLASMAVTKVHRRRSGPRRRGPLLLTNDLEYARVVRCSLAEHFVPSAVSNPDPRFCQPGGFP